MQVFRTLAGYSYGRADVVRRAMSKKKRDVMESERDIFIHGLKNDRGEYIIDGCVRKGIDEKTADEVFSDMISFASYGFNKSHTAAYGLIAYQTAYLKAYYPKAFMAAILTSVIGDVTKTVVYINECNRLRIRVLPPHVNYSSERFAVSGDNIVFPLLAIKNIGRALIHKIERSRVADGEFKSYWDFCKRISGPELNRRALECLIKAGALDGLGMNRYSMLQNLDLAIESAAKESDMYAGGQLDMFSAFGGDDFSSEPVFAHFEESDKNDLLNAEKEVSGLYFSGHPLEEYRVVTESLKCPKTVDLYEFIENGKEAEIDNKKVKFIGVLNSVKKKVTKHDDIMAFCGIEDLYGEIELIVFPKVLAQYMTLVNANNVVLVEGRISVKDDEIKLLAESISIAPKTLENLSEGNNNVKENTSKGKKGVFLRIEKRDEKLIGSLKNLISIFSGNLPVYIYCANTKQYEFLGVDHLVSINAPLEKELKYVLGENNVVIKQ